MTPSCHINAKQVCKLCHQEKVVSDNKVKHEAKVLKLFKGDISITEWGNFRKLSDKVTAKCNLHGEYVTILSCLLSSPVANCKGCVLEAESLQFINKAKALHGSKYKYVGADYVSSRAYMKIYCNTHKEYFKQRPSAHLQGQGCPTCGKEDRNRVSTKLHEDYIREIKEVHGNKYTYEKTLYTKAHNKIIVSCKEHGAFKITANNHLHGGGCRECAHKKLSSNTREFIEKAVKLKGDKDFDFSEVTYVTNKVPVKITCLLHNEVFMVSPNRFLDAKASGGCKTCGKVLAGRWTLRSILKVPDVRNKVGYFYKGDINTLNGFKLGLTGCLGSRHTGYRTDLREYDSVNFNYTKVLKSDYYTCAVIEVVFKKLLKRFNVKHNLTFGGKNEVYDPPVVLVNLLEEVLDGRYELELNTLSHIVTHNSHQTLLKFVDFLEGTVR